MPNNADQLSSDIQEANLTTTGADTVESDEFDMQNLEGTALLGIVDRVSGTAAMSIAVTHSLTTGGTFNAVPADALFTLSTGQAGTFSNLSTAASEQYLGLNVQKLRRFVRVEFTGTDIDHNLAIVMVGGKQYSGGIG